MNAHLQLPRLQVRRTTRGPHVARKMTFWPFGTEICTTLLPRGHVPVNDQTRCLNLRRNDSQKLDSAHRKILQGDKNTKSLCSFSLHACLPQTPRSDRETWEGKWQSRRTLCSQGVTAASEGLERFQWAEATCWHPCHPQQAAVPHANAMTGQFCRMAAPNQLLKSSKGHTQAQNQSWVLKWVPLILCQHWGLPRYVKMCVFQHAHTEGTG